MAAASSLQHPMVLQLQQPMVLLQVSVIASSVDVHFLWAAVGAGPPHVLGNNFRFLGAALSNMRLMQMQALLSKKLSSSS